MLAALSHIRWHTPGAFPLTPVGLLLALLAACALALGSSFSPGYFHIPDSWVFVLRVVGWSLTAMLYFLLLRRVRAGAVLHTRTVIGVTAVLAAPFLLAFPVFAGDIFAYVATAKVTILGNPYVLTPSVLGNDAILHGVFGMWQGWPLTYGPLWAGFVKILSWLTHDNAALFMLFRATSLAVVLGIGAVLCRVASPARAALLLWSPVILVDAIADAHNDIFVGAAILGAAILINRPWRSGLAFAVSVALKYTTLPILPLFVAAQPGRKILGTRILAYLGTTAAMLVILFLPWWVGGETFLGVRNQSTLFVPPPITAQYPLFFAAFSLGIPVHPEVFARAFGAALFVLTLAYLTWRLATKRSALVPAIALGIGAYLFFGASYVQAWYLLWLLPLLPLLSRRDATRWFGALTVVWAFLQVYPYYFWTI